MPELNDTRAEPASNAPVPYDTQLELDVRSAFDSTEKTVNEAPPADDKGSERTYNRDEVGRFAKKDGDDKGTEDKGAARPDDSGRQEQSEASAKDAAARDGDQHRSAAADNTAAPDGNDQEVQQPDKLVPQATGSPPPGWSVASKAAWDALPDHIRADVVKREGEVAQGLAALRDYKDIKPYAEQARQSGTTLAAALQRYTTMEGALRRDPANGLATVAQNIGLSKTQAAELFADLAQKLGHKPPSPQPQPTHQTGGVVAPPASGGSHQDDPLEAVIGPLLEQRLGPNLDQRLDSLLQQRIGPMSQELGLLKTHLTRQLEADQNARSQSVTKAIETFAADPAHRYFSDLEEVISDLFERGVVERTADPIADLKKAYDMAAWNHPEVREVLINERLKTKTVETKAKEQQVAARAQAASRSITGSASSGTDAAPNKGKRNGMSYEADLEADVRGAMEALIGRA